MTNSQRTTTAVPSCSSSNNGGGGGGQQRRRAAAIALALALTASSSEAFTPRLQLPAHLGGGISATGGGDGGGGRGGGGGGGGDSTLSLEMRSPPRGSSCSSDASGAREVVSAAERAGRFLSASVATAALGAAVLLAPGSASAENELSAKYGGSFDSSLVDQNCLVDKCSLQAKACLADDPSCRKGLTCTAKCLGDNACITGCMARYGDENLDNLLKCTIEDNNCIKIAILEGGADAFGEEPRSPAPTVKNFQLASMEGAWYKVVGFNPNYDCYACQRNTFSPPRGDSLQLDVEFSMPHLMPDGTPPPPSKTRESVRTDADGLTFGSQSIGFNQYQTHETMVFDQAGKGADKKTDLVMNGGKTNEASYARTAHSEGEMFGLKFWENWYVIGENDVDQPDFKFVFYNGKTRQNTYEGAFVYSRSRELDPSAMKKVYKIASDAGMNPDQFCKIRNGCFENEGGGSGGIGDGGGGILGGKNFAKAASSSSDSTLFVDQAGIPVKGPAQSGPFRGLLASTKVSQLLGVESVAAETDMLKALSEQQESSQSAVAKRAWWYEVGDYIENPHRHFQAMDSLRLIMDWPEEVKSQ